jgi:hypothetical protein
VLPPSDVPSCGVTRARARPPVSGVPLGLNPSVTAECGPGVHAPSYSTSITRVILGKLVVAQMIKKFK